MNAVEDLLVKWANGTLSIVEKAELGKHYDLDSLDDFDNKTSQLELRTSAINEEWDKLDKKKRKAKAKFSNLIWLAALICLSAVLAYWYVSSLGPTKTIKNTTYEPIQIAMEDQTEILLAPGSQLSYNESKFTSNRKVWLEGRAFFDVRVKGDFSVVSDNGIVSVLGTSFDVWEIGDSHFEVACFTGKVNVAIYGGMESTIERGQLFVSDDGSMEIKDAHEGNKPKWLENSIVYEGIPLYMVYEDLGNYYRESFVGYQSKRNFNGELPTNNLQKVIEILNAVTSDIYKVENNQVMVSKSE